MTLESKIKIKYTEKMFSACNANSISLFDRGCSYFTLIVHNVYVTTKCQITAMSLGSKVKVQCVSYDS